MHYTDGTDYVDVGGGVRRFKETPAPSSVLGYQMMNAVQQEMIDVIVAGNQTLRLSGAADESASYASQLLPAINYLDAQVQVNVDTEKTKLNNLMKYALYNIRNGWKPEASRVGNNEGINFTSQPNSNVQGDQAVRSIIFEDESSEMGFINSALTTFYKKISDSTNGGAIVNSLFPWTAGANGGLCSLDASNDAYVDLDSGFNPVFMIYIKNDTTLVKSFDFITTPINVGVDAINRALTAEGYTLISHKPIGWVYLEDNTTYYRTVSITHEPNDFINLAELIDALAWKATETTVNANSTEKVPFTRFSLPFTRTDFSLRVKVLITIETTLTPIDVPTYFVVKTNDGVSSIDRQNTFEIKASTEDVNTFMLDMYISSDFNFTEPFFAIQAVGGTGSNLAGTVNAQIVGFWSDDFNRFLTN